MVTFLHRALQQYKDMCSQGSLWLLGPCPCVAKEVRLGGSGWSARSPSIPHLQLYADEVGIFVSQDHAAQVMCRHDSSLGWIEVAILEFSIWL